MILARLAAVSAATIALMSAQNAAQIERGRYLVEEVAKCGDCHTPKGADGQLDRSKWLKGAVLDFQPLEPVPKWHKTSPDLTRPGRLWSKWGELALLNYLKTGLAPSGKPADPPMPAYKLKHEDAEAIVEYLKSLK